MGKARQRHRAGRRCVPPCASGAQPHAGLVRVGLRRGELGRILLRPAVVTGVYFHEPNCLPHTSAGGGCCCTVPWQKQPMTAPAFSSGPCPSASAAVPSFPRTGARRSTEQPPPAGRRLQRKRPLRRPLQLQNPSIHTAPADVSSAKIQGFRNEADHVAVARNCPPDYYLSIRSKAGSGLRSFGSLSHARPAVPRWRIGPDASGATAYVTAPSEKPITMPSSRHWKPPLVPLAPRALSPSLARSRLTPHGPSTRRTPVVVVASPVIVAAD